MEVPQPLDDERLLMKTRGEPRAMTRRSPDRLSGEQHEDAYIAAVITRFGIRPILNASDIDTARATQERARTEDEPALIYGISGNSPAKRGADRATWLSGTGIASPDGAGLFGMKEVEIEAG